MTSRKMLRAIWGCYLLLIFSATHVPIPADAWQLITTWDKVVHFGIFLILGVLTLAAFQKQRRSGWALGFLLLIYAALDEFLQRWVNRTADVMDWCCDAAGVLLSVLLFQLITFRKTAEAKSEMPDDGVPVANVEQLVESQSLP